MIADFVSWPLAGAAVVALLFAGAALLVLAGRKRTRWLQLSLWAGASLAAMAGAAGLFGVTAVALQQSRLMAQRPEAGLLVDAGGGAQSFVLCEGPNAGAPIVWLSGGYGQGAFMRPLHERAARERRSCLIDRPGTGWARPASRPRTVEDIIDEVHTALANAGERGPFVLVGHSMGGLYAANFADAYPQDTRAIVLLDPTPPLWFIEQAHLYGCGDPDAAGLSAWATVFGLGLVRPLNPMWGPHMADQRAVFGQSWEIIVGLESRPASIIASNRATYFACREGLSLVRTRGSLGDVPLLAIAQAPDANAAAYVPPGLSDRVRRNRERILADWAQEYVSYSSRSTRELAPPGAGHQFPITMADWTWERISTFLAGLPEESAQ
ncbi:MAG: alpha/beta hydrolase [Alphaproteobacteria bacterium]|nr:alpha/beta hydrolase [Alphaproteobacteria bacterium]